MNIYRFADMIVRTFMGFGGAKLVKLHPASNGWVLIIRDEVTGEEYLGNFVPIKSQKEVCPNSADELLKMQEGV